MNNMQDDLKQADFKHGYHALVFFCQFLMSSIPGSKDYLEIVTEKQMMQEPATDIIAANFLKHFGWIYNVHIVAEFERIETDKVYDLPVIQFLERFELFKAKKEF